MVLPQMTHSIVHACFVEKLMAVGDMLFINCITSVEVRWLRSVMIYFKILIYTAQLKGVLYLAV